MVHTILTVNAISLQNVNTSSPVNQFKKSRLRVSLERTESHTEFHRTVAHFCPAMESKSGEHVKKGIKALLSRGIKFSERRHNYIFYCTFLAHVHKQMFLTNNTRNTLNTQNVLVYVPENPETYKQSQL